MFLNNKIPFVAPAEPHALNERIVAQQGLFLIQGYVGMTFDQNLIALGESELQSKVIQFLIPNDWRILILSELKKMNIGPDSLFPGLDGFSRSIRLDYGTLLDQINDPYIEKNQRDLAMKYGFLP